MAKKTKTKFDPNLAEEKNIKLLEFAIEENSPILLKGETGTGKTSLVRYLAQKHGKEITRVNLNGSTDVDDFVGRFLIDGKSTVWVDGALVSAMEKGQWLLVDEINASPPEINFVLHSLLDDDREIVLSGVGKDKSVRKVKPHKDFRFFASMNPRDYAGTHELNLALLSRFPFVINFGFPSLEDEVEIIKIHSGYQDERTMITLVREVAHSFRHAYEKEEIRFICSTRELIGVARLLKNGFSMDDACYYGIVSKCEKEDKEAVENTLKLAVGYKMGKGEKFVSIQDREEALNKREQDVKKSVKNAKELRILVDQLLFEGIAKLDEERTSHIIDKIKRISVKDI